MLDLLESQDFSLALRPDDLGRWVALLRGIEDRKAAVLLALLIFRCCWPEQRGQWLLATIEELSTYDIIFLKGLQLGEETARLMAGSCLAELQKAGATSLDTCKKVFKCLREFKGFDPARFLMALVQNGRSNSAFELSQQVLDSGVTLSMAGNCLLVEKTVDTFFEADCKDMPHVVRFVASILGRHRPLAAIVFSQLIKKVMTSIPDDRPHSLFLPESVALVEENRLGLLLLGRAGTGSGPEVSLELALLDVLDS